MFSWLQDSASLGLTRTPCDKTALEVFMTARLILAVLFGVALGGAAVTVNPLHSAPAPEPRSQKWEYKVVRCLNAVNEDFLTNQLNTLAQDGWEYAGPVTSVANANSIAFRRPK